MTDDDLLVVFLDANVLAKPVTRTLILRCAPSGYVVTWSAAAEEEADRHLAGRRLRVSALRGIAEIALCDSGVESERFASTPVGDRQILADAECAGSTFLVTEDVDDFASADLNTAGVTAVNPDLFLSVRAERETYRRALHAMVAGMTDPARTPAQLHAAIARQHPRLFQRFRGLFDVEAQLTGHRDPAVLYRGRTCLRCLRTRPEDAAFDGLCSECASAV